MKKITIKKALALLTFVFIGSVAFAQIQPAGTWKAEGDLNILKVTGDADNGDGVSDGALNFNGASAVIGQGGIFTFDGTMQEGKNYAINSTMYNVNGSFVKVRVSLHNKNDDTELAVYDVTGTQMNNGDVEAVIFNYTATSSDVGDILELRFIRNDNGVTSRDFRVDNVNLNGSKVGARTIVYSEDFRYHNFGRGYEKGVISMGGQVDTQIVEPKNDIPDLADSNNLFNPAVDRQASRIPNGASRDQKTISTKGNDGSTNFPIDVYAVFKTLDLTDANILINPSDDYVYASFWTQRRYGDGDIATITIRVSTDYAGDASTATWTTLPLHSGKISDTSDGRKYVKGMVDLSAYTGSTTVTMAMRYKGSASAYSSSNRNGTFYFSDLQFITQETPITNVWNGGSTDLSAEANWDTKAAPVNTTNNYVFPSGLTNYPTITGTFTANNITIEDGASLVTNGATVNSNVTYKRQLSTPTPTGTFATDKLEGWHLISSPVLNQALNDTFISENGIASGSGTNKGVSTYTEATNTWDYFEDAETFTFVKGQGYSVKRTATGNVTFNGNLHLSDVATPNLARTADGFHLLGNPYPAYISSEQFLDNNTTVSDNKTIWVWNDGSNSYDTHISTADFKIAPGQAFFVQVNTSGGTLTFAESNQAHNGTDTFLRTEVKPEITLNITDGNLKRYAKVYYNNNATKSFDSGYDGEIFGGITTPFEVYSQLLENNQGKNYQIQSLPNTDLEAMVVPVGLKAENGKEITFSAEALNIPAGLKVFLEDRNSNTFTRLDEANSEYKVTLTEAVNGIGRFYLHTRSSALSTKDVVLENISIYKTNNTNLKIVGLQQGAASVKLFNVLGKQVMSASFNTNGVQDVSLPNLATGVYIVQLSTENGKLNKKIILE